jgi:hypothetical protein
MLSSMTELEELNNSSLIEWGFKSITFEKENAEFGQLSKLTALELKVHVNYFSRDWQLMFKNLENFEIENYSNNFDFGTLKHSIKTLFTWRN